MENIKKFENFSTNEGKKDKWIQDAIKKPGSLRKSLKKKEGEKITKAEIDSELQALKGKDKDPKKKGVQGLKGKDLSKFRKLNLARTLKSMKEHQETQNYMFFGNDSSAPSILKSSLRFVYPVILYYKEKTYIKLMLILINKSTTKNVRHFQYSGYSRL